MEKSYEVRPIEVVLECPKCKIQMDEQDLYPYVQNQYHYKCPKCGETTTKDVEYPYIKYVRVVTGK